MGYWDVNCLVGRWPTAALAYQDVPGLLARMDQLGIARALVGHTHSLHFDPTAGNAALTELLAMAAPEARARLWPVWALVPPVTGEQGRLDDLAARLTQHGVRAVRLYPRDHNYSLGTPEAAELLTWLAALPVIALIDLEQTSWEELDRVAGAHPTLPIVACHVGYRGLRRLVGVLARRPNLHLDLSFFSTHRALEWLVSRLGPQQILFGTHAPVADGGGAVTRLKLSHLSADEQTAIGAGNLQRLLGEPVVDLPTPPAAYAPDLPAAQVLAGQPINAAWDVIDAHAHIGPWFNFFIPDASPASMVPVMERCGVRHTVVSATLAIGPDGPAGNAEVAALVQAQPEHFSGYAVFSPHQPDSAANVARYLQQPGFVGIKIHPDTHAYSVNGPLYRPAWELAQRFHVPVLTHTFVDSPWCDPLHFDEVATNFPDVSILLGHSGVTGEGHRRAIQVALKHPHLYLELCGSFTTGVWIKRMVDAVGAERVIYGSDFPFIELRYGLGRVVFAPLSREALQLVLGGNARRLLKLPPAPAA
jgi:predicted TIM-barrel fold metal-dependent hydrolase